MPTYLYKARNLQGKLVKGIEEFPSKTELADALRKDGLLLIYVTDKTQKLKSKPINKIRLSKTYKLDKKTSEEKRDIFESLQKVKSQDIMIFGLHLSNMLGAGITLLSGLSIIVQQTSNKKFKRVIKHIHRDVEAGSSFSIALQAYSHIFTPLFINMVRLGETTGQLDRTLVKLTQFMEHDMDLKQKIKSALTYPTILIVLGFLVVMFISTFVMPQFIKMFKEAGVPLGLPTLIVYGFGQIVKKFWYLILLGVAFFIIGTKSFLKTKTARLMLDHILLKIPVIGSLIHKVIISRFAMTLSVLITTGVPLLESLKMVEDVVGNAVMAAVIRNAQIKISRGTKIADALQTGEKFPLDVVQMIAVGEETGTLDKMLAKISDFYDIIIDNSIKKLTTFIEPLFLLIMGFVVGFIMFSMFIPLFKMVQTIRM